MTPTSSPGSSSSVNIRWPTHLSISADLIFGTVTSFNFNHEVETTIFDINYKEHAGETQIWSRTEPDPGAYIATNCIFETAPMRVVVPDIAHLRRIPEEFDDEHLLG
ncbi:hypothetical protein CF327_g5647 [Tilletia walkeri]|uniref:Uncharacterized protein n=1 Tax=Tilletia walkeri TaxID=117179 RepID=A0A8X7N1J3_9BASI|nr:hypothetical protein CF327_g5647 [Tilletia walkeri]KAE8261601.1 hypothetical protein A4X09_0g7639 [Tilletia walkeri]